MKLFVSDLDGTLLNKEHQADDIILRGIETIYRNGHIFSVCTGRNLEMTRIAGLPATHTICMNGACILDQNDRVLSLHTISKTMLKAFLHEADMNFEYQTLDRIYTTQSREVFTGIYMKNQKLRNRSFNKGMMRILDTFVYDCDPEFILDQDVCKINLHFPDMTMKARADAFASRYKDQIVNAPSVAIMAEMTDIAATKGNAVKELASILKINDDQVYVYGDGINDISMLEAFENSYSPINASQEALSACHHTVGPFEEHSVIRHMLDQIGEEDHA